MVHKVKDIRMGRGIYLIDASVSGGVLKRHKASMPNVGVPVEAPKTQPMPEFEALEVPNHVIGESMTFRICAGRTWRDHTIRRHSSSLTGTTGVRGM